MHRFFLFLFLWIMFLIFCSCGLEKKDSHFAPSGNKINISASDAIRQKDIDKDYLKDNFNFDQFKDVDWGNTESFGKNENNITLTNKKSSLKTMPILSAFGASSEDYYEVKIRGDGSCWIRTAIISFLFVLFFDDSLFNEFIKNVPLIAQEYKDVPGFASRFLVDDLITLLKTLKGLSPQDRIKQFNKEKADNFLDYSFRAFFHAHYYEEVKDTLPQNDHEIELKKFLNEKSWNAARIIGQVYQKFLPKKPYFIVFHGFGGENVNLAYALSFGLGKFIIARNIPKLFNPILDDPDNDLAPSPQELKENFNIEKKEDFLENKFLQAVPEYINNNHYNLLVNARSAKAFGFN